MNRLKIMIIDDEECIRESLRWHLEDLGHDVITAHEPHACHVYQGHHCSRTEACGDALLIDYRMPKMSGLEFVKQLKQRGCKGVTENMMIMSGDTTAFSHSEATALGCRIANKPLRLDALDRWLDEILGRSGHTPLDD